MHQNKQEIEEEVTAIVCHYSHRVRESSKLSEKNWTSSGSNTPCTKLCATLTPFALGPSPYTGKVW